MHTQRVAPCQSAEEEGTGRRGSLAFIWHLYRLSIPIVRNYPVRRGRLVESALRVSREWAGRVEGVVEQANCRFYWHLSLLFSLLLLSVAGSPTSRARNSLGVSQINFQVAPCSGRPKWLKGSTLRLGTNIVFN